MRLALVILPQLEEQEAEEARRVHGLSEGSSVRSDPAQQGQNIGVVSHQKHEGAVDWRLQLAVAQGLSRGRLLQQSQHLGDQIDPEAVQIEVVHIREQQLHLDLLQQRHGLQAHRAVENGATVRRLVVDHIHQGLGDVPATLPGFEVRAVE